MKLEDAIAIAITVATDGIEALPDGTMLHDIRHAQAILRNMATECLERRIQRREQKLENEHVRERAQKETHAA